MEENKKQEIAFRLEKDYEEKAVEIIRQALTGEVGTNKRMIQLLEEMNEKYLDKLEDNDIDIYDANDFTSVIDIFKEAERDDRNVIEAAKGYLECYAIITEKKLVFIDKNGNICDEYGNRLSEDGERRVFEVVKGCKK